MLISPRKDQELRANAHREDERYAQHSKIRPPAIALATAGMISVPGSEASAQIQPGALRPCQMTRPVLVVTSSGGEVDGDSLGIELILRGVRARQ